MNHLKIEKMKKKLFLTIAVLLSVLFPATGQQTEKNDDPALVPPVINTNPGKDKMAKNLDFAMNCGGIACTPQGRLWACWTAGGDDANAFIVLSWSDKKGKKWTDTKVIVDGQDSSLDQKRKIMGGAIWCDPNGNLWLFFCQSMQFFDGRSGTWCSVCRNPDADSPTWSAPVRIWHGSATNAPIVLKNGYWALPVSLGTSKQNLHSELDLFRGAGMLLTTDQGKTWTWQGATNFPEPDFNEHHLVELNDGRIWMSARTKNGIWQSFSSDEGVTWTKPEKYLEHCPSRHYIGRLMSGNLLLVKHGDINERTKYRNFLCAYLSVDDGKTWIGKLCLDQRRCSYPFAQQGPDGTIYVTYDRQRSNKGEILLSRFTEQDILSRNPTSEISALELVVTRAGNILQKK